MSDGDMDVGVLVSEVMTLAAYDTLAELEPGEMAALQRELGDDWAEQLLTPVTQPMTLRSGRILAGGGDCPLAVRFLARVLVLTFLTLAVMAAIQPYVPAALAASSQAWAAAKAYGSDAWSMAKSCPVGIDQRLWKNMLCGKYYEFLRELQYNTASTISQMSEVFRNVSVGVGASAFTMARVYSFVRWFVRSSDQAYMVVLGGVCTAIAGLFRLGARSAPTSAPAPAVGVPVMSAEEVAALQTFMLQLATSFQAATKVSGGAFRLRRTRKRTGHP